MQNSQNSLRVILIGDVCGALGRAMFQKTVPVLKQKYNFDALIVNGENSAGDGRGITSRIMNFFKHNGANIVTSGNHIWAKRDIYSYLSTNTDLLRPANFPSSDPGTGVTTFMVNDITVGVINLQGRIFMRELVDCPFRTADSVLIFLKSRTNIILVDFHTETTSEKAALANYLDGKVSAVVGTHTHIQTNDSRILPKGTAFITDLGMTGALESVIGVKKEIIIEQMLTQMPIRFEVETKGPAVISGILVDIDTKSGKAISVESIRIVEENISIAGQDELDAKNYSRH